MIQTNQSICYKYIPEIYRFFETTSFKIFKLKKVKKCLKNLKSFIYLYSSIMLPLKMKSRFLVTVHDFTHLYFPQYHTPMNIKNATDGLILLWRKAHVIAISKSTFRLYEMKMDKKDYI
jgi:hypothetical protein